MGSSGSYTVTRRRHVAAPPRAVRDRVVDLHRWQDWSPWEDLDPALRRTYGGPTSGIGAWYEWDGNRKAGRGRMEVLDADEESVTVDLQFLKPFKSHSTTRFTFEPQAGGTDVTWTVTGPHTVMTKVMGIFTSMDRLIGPDFEKGLDRLKVVTESDAGTSGGSGR